MSKDYLNSTPTADYSTDRQPFFGREWAFQKLIREPGMVINSLNCSLVLADVGGGKSSLLHHIRHNPHLCSGTLLAYFQCSRSTSAFDFVFSVASQLQSKIPYLQVPSREQLAQLYHFHHGPRTIARSDATDEPSVASQCSVRSIIDRSDMDSIDLLTTTTSASDRFHSSTYSFPLAPASSATLNTPAAAHNPAPTSSVHYSRFSNVSPLSPSCSPVPVNRCSPNFYRPPAARNSPGSSPDAGSVESGNTCTLSTAAAYVITGTSNAALHSSSVLSSQSRRHDVREDVFWRYVLEPIIDHGLNRWEDQCFLLLIDSIDDQPEICELLSRHLLLLPNFLHVIVTARSTRRKGFSRMFNGCRKVIIDDIRKDDVLNDMRQFVQFEASKQDLKLSDECIQCICLSSNGCYLYVQLYFQVCLPNHLIVCNKPTLPVTLNGLFYTIFTIWFDRLNTIAQCTVRRLFSLLLSTATFAISIDEARSLLMNQTHLGQLPDIVNQLQHMQLIHVQQEPRPESFKDFWVSTAVQHRSADSSTPDTPKVLHDSLQAVIRAQHNPMLRWLSDVKHCGLRFHCTKALGHLLYVLHNPITQNGFALAHHVQAASSGSLMPNLQAFLFLIYCHPNQLSDTFSSTTSPSEFLMGPQTLRPQLHPLIVYIESCAQVNTTRLFVNDDSNPDHTEAELISEMLGDLQSGDVQFPTGSFEIASEQSDLDMNNNCVPIAQDSRDVAAQWPSTALIVKPNWAINNNLNILQPPKEVIPPANCLNPKLIFEPCQMDPSSGTFDMQQLLSAITGQDENLLKMLLDSCPHLLYSYDDRGLTPLLHAIHVDCADSILRLLVSYDLDINQPSEQLQLSPLMLASARDRLSSVDLLLEMDADVHAKDTFGRTALACAVRAGSSAGVVELLITWGSRADECDHFGRSLIVLTVIGMCTWSSCTIASAESTNNPPDHSITSDSNNMVTNHDSSKPDYFQKKQKPATLSSTGRTDANQLKVDAKRKSAVNPAAKMRGHISRFPNTGKGKRHSLIECVPQFRANRVMTGSATAAQATWVRASQMLEPNNAPVRPNTSFEHRLLRTLFNHHRSNVANIDANGVSSSDVQQRELNVLQVIRQLVDGGADVEQSDHGQRTTLHWAAAAGTSPLLLNYLIQLVGRRQLQQPDVNGWLPVHWAAATGQVPLLKTLSTDGLLHQLTTDRLSVLACAVRSNQFDAVISLVRRCGARLDQVDAQRRSVVNWVVGAAGVRLRWLRRQRASAQRHKSRTASCCTSACAASDGKSVNEAESIDGGEPDPIDRFDQLTELPSKLLDPLVDSIDDEVQASLDQLSLQENEELELPDEDADEESEDDDEEGEGEEEGEEDEEENADRLEDSKEDDEQYRRRVRMLKLLIALGADLNFRDSNGRTALHLAAWLDDAKVTQLLLSNAALVDPVDSDGRTPLYFCAVANSLSTARLLLAHRARLDWLCSSSTPGSADTNDRSILSVALRQNRYRFVRLLLRSGRQSARNDPQSMIGWSQLVTQVAARSSPKWKSLFSHYGYKC